ncbi:hypothetical protein [Methanoregula formicica]|uniref:Uncharacterized protein n=1 Tax=Methanoregula formicica (strain DSM 22288 / NBRC 105244 / SMSP) TaxID=593750 RepID=L0HDY0_METFS|nr:hypothetical protein [Methanoregula formicica]AGB02942.1 hypothetical protein Metfor_1924 [Methanoregula formicica SMSP]
MNIPKTWVVLLALLLAAMAMVPMVSAGDGNPDAAGNTYLDLINPVSNGDINLFDKMGLQRPEIEKNSIPLKRYDESKEIVERIMAIGKVTNEAKSVIGLYDFGSSQVLLIDSGDSVLALSYDGNKVKTTKIVPKLLGEMKESGPAKPASLQQKTLGDSVTTNILTQLYSISIASPESSSAVKTIYQVTKTRTDEYKNYFGEIRASLTVTGKFYVDYGISISSIIDQSSYYVSFPYTMCSFTHAGSGTGSTAGQVNAHLKTGAAFARAQMDNWVGENAWMNLNPWQGGSQSTWMSGNGDGCTG